MADRIDKLMASPWVTRLIVVFAVGTCLNFGGLGVALFLIRGQAQKGQMARDRQQAVYPVSVKLYTWASKDPASGITAADLACFKYAAVCPPASK